jgi:hypothetical protein
LYLNKGIFIEVDGVEHFQDKEMSIYRGGSLIKRKFVKSLNLNVIQFNKNY